MFDLIAEIRQTMRSNRLRTILTGISVAWGVFMLILLLGAARGMQNSFDDNVNASTMSRIQIWSGRTSKAYRGYKEDRYIELRNGDRDALMRRNGSNISAVATFASNDTATIIGPHNSVRGYSATYPEGVSRDIPEITRGRNINSRDIDQCRRVMILNERNANLLFGSADSAVGSTVQCMGLAWTVAGVYEHQWRNYSYVPYTTHRAITGNSDAVYQLNVEIKDINTEDEALALERGIRSTLAREHEFDPTDESAVWMWNSFTSYLRSSTVGGYINIAVWVIGLLTLLTGIVGVSNIMFVSVRERTHEIGIRRAIGAAPRHILTQILAESVSITAVFGYMGVFGGMVILQIINAVIGDVDGFKNPTVDISIAIEVTVALIAAGTLAGLFPALKALKVKPVEALRDE